MGFALLCTTSDSEKMKKMSCFLWKLSSIQMKYWMKLHAIWIQFKFNRFKLNWIELKCNWVGFQLRRNEMQIGEKGIVNLLINLIIYDYGVGKFLFTISYIFFQSSLKWAIGCHLWLSTGASYLVDVNWMMIIVTCDMLHS